MKNKQYRARIYADLILDAEDHNEALIKARSKIPSRLHANMVEIEPHIH